MRIGMQRLRLKYLKKMLRYKWPQDYDENAQGRVLISRISRAMAIRLTKKRKPDDVVFIHGIKIHLCYLPRLRKLVKLKNRSSMQDVVWKLGEINLISKIMMKRLIFRLKDNARERKLLIMKKDKLDVLLALRCNSCGFKINPDKENYMTADDTQRLNEHNHAHKKLHLYAR